MKNSFTDRRRSMKKRRESLATNVVVTRAIPEETELAIRGKGPYFFFSHRRREGESLIITHEKTSHCPHGAVAEDLPIHSWMQSLLFSCIEKDFTRYAPNSWFNPATGSVRSQTGLTNQEISFCQRFRRLKKESFFELIVAREQGKIFKKVD